MREEEREDDDDDDASRGESGIGSNEFTSTLEIASDVGSVRVSPPWWEGVNLVMVAPESFLSLEESRFVEWEGEYGSDDRGPGGLETDR